MGTGNEFYNFIRAYNLSAMRQARVLCPIIVSERMKSTVTKSLGCVSAEI